MRGDQSGLRAVLSLSRKFRALREPPRAGTLVERGSQWREDAHRLTLGLKSGRLQSPLVPQPSVKRCNLKCSPRGRRQVEGSRKARSGDVPASAVEVVAASEKDAWIEQNPG